ncbi:hypothetical protein HDU92_004183 [Lobulomyces angularis]|nr:hypothetical protein HDU92_004183 [Lobulomyces angularis]
MIQQLLENNLITSRSVLEDADITRSSLPGHNPHGISIPIPFSNTTLNHDFKPIPTTSSKCPKLDLFVMLDSTIFVAGGNVHGRLEIISTVDYGLKLGDISVEFTGFESVCDKEITTPSASFLSARVLFQGVNCPKTNAVRGEADANNMWVANKGKTTFPFAFKIPQDAPSSYTFKNIAQLRYVVTGVVVYHYNKRTETMFTSSDAFVVESFTSVALPPPLPQKVSRQKRSIKGDIGEVFITALLEKSLYCSGNDIYVQLQVKNYSKSKVRLKLNLNKKLLLLKKNDDIKVINACVKEIKFKGKNYQFDSGEERILMLHIQIPPHLTSIRNTALAEIFCNIQVELNMGFLTPNLSLELPIIILNPASLAPPKQLDLTKNLHPKQYNVLDEDLILKKFSPSIKKGEVRNCTVIAPKGVGEDELAKLKRRSSRAALPWNENSLLLEEKSASPNAKGSEIKRMDVHDEVKNLKETIDKNVVLKKSNLKNKEALNDVEESCQEPSFYVEASERSLRIKKKTQRIYAGDISFMLPDENFSFTEYSILDHSFGPLPIESKVIYTKQPESYSYYDAKKRASSISITSIADDIYKSGKTLEKKEVCRSNLADKNMLTLRTSNGGVENKENKNTSNKYLNSSQTTKKERRQKSEIKDAKEEVENQILRVNQSRLKNSSKDKVLSVNKTLPISPGDKKKKTNKDKNNSVKALKTQNLNVNHNSSTAADVTTYSYFSAVENTFHSKNKGKTLEKKIDSQQENFKKENDLVNRVHLDLGMQSTVLKGLKSKNMMKPTVADLIKRHSNL